MNNLPEKYHRFSGKSHFYLATASLCALVITFLISNADFTFQTKATFFLAVIFIYLIFFAFIYFRQKQRLKTPEILSQPADSVFTSEIETKLFALDEANQYFGSSLKSADMFRFVANRIKEIIPFDVCTLAFANQDKSKLKFIYAAGENSQNFTNFEIESTKGLAGKTFQSGMAQMENQLFSDKKVIPGNALINLTSGIAVPLLQRTECFGVLILYGNEKNQFGAQSLQLLEAVGARAASLFLSSQAFEISLTNALTDALTNLPNERGFYLVLENQIAESQRFRDERPLTILTIDIKNFDELNQKYGHATGDRLLIYAADTVKTQLRQMDFLARSISDEFLAVLPTASDDITREVVGRIEKTFVSKPFEISLQEKVHLQLNFGAASFGKDGETSEQLLKHARLRKQQSKSTETSKVLWFPKEYVN